MLHEEDTIFELDFEDEAQKCIYDDVVASMKKIYTRQIHIEEWYGQDAADFPTGISRTFLFPGLQIMKSALQPFATGL